MANFSHKTHTYDRKNAVILKLITNLAILTTVLTFQYCIWEEKLRKRCPSFTTISNLFTDLHAGIFERSLTHCDAAARFAFPLYRPQWALRVP